MSDLFYLFYEVDYAEGHPLRVLVHQPDFESAMTAWKKTLTIPDGGFDIVEQDYPTEGVQRVWNLNNVPLSAGCLFRPEWIVEQFVLDEHGAFVLN